MHRPIVFLRPLGPPTWMKSLELIDALLEMKQVIYEDVNDKDPDFDIDKFIHDMAAKSHYKEETLAQFYNAILLWKFQAEKNKREFGGVNKWTKGELTILRLYAETLEHKKARTVIFRELSELIERTEGSISFVYYKRDLYEEEETVDEGEILANVQTATLVPTEVSVIRNEAPAIPAVDPTPPVMIEKKEESVDILDLLTSLLSNFENLAEFDLTGLLNGLNLLSELAVKNTGVDEKTKGEMKSLREENERLNGEVDEYKRRFSNIKNAVQQFDQFDSVEKIKRLKEYHQKLVANIH